MADEPVKEKPAKSGGCESVNRHAFLTNKEGVKVPTPTKCSLEKGHAGDHKALFKTGKKTRDGDVEEKEYSWNSAAESELKVG